MTVIIPITGSQSFSDQSWLRIALFDQMLVKNPCMEKAWNLKINEKSWNLGMRLLSLALHGLHF